MYTAARMSSTYSYTAPDLYMPESAVMLPRRTGGMDREDGQVIASLANSTGDTKFSRLRWRVPHEISSMIIQNATGFVPSFGIDTAYRSPFDDHTSGEEAYRDSLIAALEMSAKLRKVNPLWMEEIEKLQERHALLVDNECDWSAEVESFKEKLGERTHRLTIDCERIKPSVSRHIASIWESLTDIRVLCFCGTIQRTGYLETIDTLRKAIAQVILRNSNHLRNVIWRCLDFEFLPYIPLCKNLEKLTLSSAMEYNIDTLHTLSGSIIPTVHTLTVIIAGNDANTSNIFTIISRWQFLSLKALIVDSIIPARDIHVFLQSAGVDIECLVLSEERKGPDEMVPLPHLPYLTQFVIPVKTAILHLTIPSNTLEDIAIAGFDYYALKHRPTRMEHIRALLRVTVRICNKKAFPHMKVLRMHGLDIVCFNVLRWFPFEEVALNFISAKLKHNNLRFEDGAGNDLNDIVRMCLMMDGGDTDYDSSYDPRF